MTNWRSIITSAVIKTPRRFYLALHGRLARDETADRMERRPNRLDVREQIYSRAKLGSG